MMRISFNQKQEDIWSTWGHRLPSGPWRKSLVMSMGALHANSGGTATPWRTRQAVYQERLWPSFAAYQGQPERLVHFYIALCWLLQAWTCISPEEEEERKTEHGVLCWFPVLAFGRAGILRGLSCTTPTASVLASVSGDTLSADSTGSPQNSSSSHLQWSADYGTGNHFAKLAGFGQELLILWQRQTSLWGLVNRFVWWC